MNPSTRKLLHQEYCRAVMNSSSGIQVFKAFYDSLENAEIVDEDSDVIDAFVDGIRGTLGQREMYKEMEKVIDSLKITFYYISLWVDPAFKVEFSDRMKQAGSTLEKLLCKAITSNESVTIRDTYGIRGVVKSELEQDEEETQHVYNLYNSFLGIVAQRSKKKKEAFKQWISSMEISLKEKEAISFILNCPFGISYRKDYIKDPKPNGYRTLQFTLSIPMYSQVLPGAQIEIQLRTSSMDWVATEGTASHEDYKDEILKQVKGIFTLKNS